LYATTDVTLYATTHLVCHYTPCMPLHTLYATTHLVCHYTPCICLLLSLCHYPVTWSDIHNGYAYAYACRVHTDMDVVCMCYDMSYDTHMCYDM